MRKSNYVTKYDYIAYYTKQPAMWFFTNAELEASINLQMDALKHQATLFDEDNDDVFGDDNALDSYDVYRESKDEKLIFDADNTNPLTLRYKNFLEQTRKTDENNPLIAEGRKLDQASKEEIIKFYNQNNDYFIIDFDDKVYQFKTSEALALETKEAILKHKKLILFQPTFIDNELMIITKCDAMVIDDINLKLIETKGTSSTKLAHFLDLFFQKKIIEKQAFLKNKTKEYFLCIVKYEKLPKKTVSFTITDAINLKKTITTTGLNEFEKALVKKGYLKTDPDLAKFYINNVLEGYFEIEELNKNDLDKAELILKTINEFERVIKDLWDHKRTLTLNSFPLKFVPSIEDKSAFKTTDLWLNLRTLYQYNQYALLKYSGIITKQTGIYLDKFYKEYKNHLTFDLNEYINKPQTNPNKYSDYYLGLNKDNFQVNFEPTKKMIDKLKPKKVYFDFESINSAIRVIDNSFPFTQAITQCSIVKDHGKGVQNEKCNNLVQDPNLIDLNWFKKVVDDLYEGDEYSYIVYNQAFEKSRLKEIAQFIDEEEYTKKINVIIENLYDLADFFSPNKQLIVIRELGGFYSIKKVLPLVEKYAYNFFVQAGCKDYKSLKIQNGLSCQQKTTARFFNSLNDEQWKELVENISIYCENDVRAMIAVEYFVIDVYQNPEKYNRL